MQGCSIKNGFKVCVFPNRSGHPTRAWRIEAHAGKREVGEMILERGSFKGQQILRVAITEVQRGSRKSGAGTAMYEAALDVACKEGALLFSDITRSSFAEAFWRKQKNKARAACVLPNPDGALSQNYYDGPLEDLEAEIEQECYDQHRNETAAMKCVDERMKTVRERLPEPERNAAGNRYWPCGAYAISTDRCGGDRSLKGVRGARTARKGPRKRRLAGLPVHRTAGARASSKPGKSRTKQEQQCMRKLRGGILAGPCSLVGAKKRKKR